MKNTLTIVALMLSVAAVAQTKDTMITWYGMPFYDTLPDGRIKLRTHVYRFDHIPTAAESLYVERINAYNYKRLPKASKAVPKKTVPKFKKAKASR